MKRGPYGGWNYQHCVDLALLQDSNLQQYVNEEVG